MALADFMATGEMELFARFKGALVVQTQRACVNATTHLVDFRQCARQTAGLGSTSPNTLRDIVDWLQASRDNYVLTDAANSSSTSSIFQIPKPNWVRVTEPLVVASQRTHIDIGTTPQIDNYNAADAPT